MKTLNQKPNGTTIIVTGVVRLAYPSLYRPKPNNMDPNKPSEYEVTVLFPKEDAEFQPNAIDELKDMKLLMRSIAVSKWGDNPGKVEYALKDGDVETNGNGDPRYPGYFYIRCSAPSEYKSGDPFVPNVFDGAKKLLTSGGKSGDWGKVIMSVFPYENAGRKGVTTRLMEVQFLYNGERIGSEIVAGSGFDTVEGAHEISVTAAGGNAPGDYDPFGDE